MGESRFRKPCVVLNPRAASGKSHRMWPRLKPLLQKQFGTFDARFTEAPDHAVQLTREALGQGADLVIAVGGDGTLNEVVNGYMAGRAGGPQSAALGLCPLGTGSDFIRSAGIPAAPEQAIAAMAQREISRLDTCVALFRAQDGTPRERYFMNTAGFGMGGQVANSAKRNFLTRYSGKGAFWWATAGAFLSYRAKQVRLTFDDTRTLEASITDVAVGNGQYHGGGLHVCPKAGLASGKLDITVIREAGLCEFLAALPYLYSGRIYSHPKCHFYRARRILAESGEEVALQVDGEALGKLPLAVEILEAAVPFAGASPVGAGPGCEPALHEPADRSAQPSGEAAGAHGRRDRIGGEGRGSVASRAFPSLAASGDGSAHPIPDARDRQPSEAHREGGSRLGFTSAGTGSEEVRA